MKNKKSFICIILLLLITISFVTNNHLDNNKLFTIIINSNNYLEGNEITSLSTPTGLEWKEGSTATAKWDTVANANYYVINVYVHDENNNYINMKETGTSYNEIDLQQEISNIVDGNNYERVIVNFSVRAQYISDFEVVESNVSNISSNLIISSTGSTPLKKATNLTLDDNYNATWDDFDNNADYYAFYYKIEYNGITKTGFTDKTITGKRVHLVNGQARENIADVLKSAYQLAGYNGETVQIRNCSDIICTCSFCNDRKYKLYK